MDYKQEIINSIIEQGRGTGDNNLFFNLTKELREDKDISMVAITQDSYALHGIPQSLRENKEFLYQAVMEISSARGKSLDNSCGEVASINRELSRSKSFALFVLENNGTLKNFSSEVTWFLEQYPKDKYKEALTLAIKLEENNIRVTSNTDVFKAYKNIDVEKKFEQVRVNITQKNTVTKGLVL